MRLLTVIALVLLAACNRNQDEVRPAQTAVNAQPPEATSLFGEPLYPTPASPEPQAADEAKLAEARATYEAAPNDADAIIWLGRRLGYLNRFRDAIDTFSLGVAKHPDDPRMYRHRGHRYITTRRFDLAIQDFEKAASLIAGKPDEVEPDGRPNARNIPTSTLQTNIWYHLGLAYYLTGNLDKARDAYESCMTVSKNNDMRVATSHWLYMTLRRLDRQDEAAKLLEPITADMDIIENASYHKLLLMYKGVETPDALLQQAESGLDRATIGYGVGNWHFYNNRRDQAVEIYRSILAANQWTSFAAIAAEADLKGMGLQKT